LIKFIGLLPLLALLPACTTVTDFSPTSAFDMPSEAEKGYAALAAGDNPGAVKWLTIALVAKPDDPYLRVDLAAAYQGLSRFDDARHFYQIVIDTAKDATADKVNDPKLQGKSLAQVAAADLAACASCDVPPEARKGYLALAAGDDPAALRGLDAGAKAKPDDIYYVLDRAAVERKLGQVDEARKLYQSVVDAEKPPKPLDPKPHIKSVTEVAAADLAQLSK
jgi:Flp pilus assembly protein TadD